MSIFESSHSPTARRMLSVLRIVVALLYIEHGMQKMFNFPPSGLPGFPVPLASEFGAASIIEILGGLFILVGFLTRPVAFILAGEMAVAYFQQHFPRSIYPLVNRGEPAVLFCFIYLYFMVAGGGEWSVDAMIERSRTGVGMR